MCEVKVEVVQDCLVIGHKLWRNANLHASTNWERWQSFELFIIIVNDRLLLSSE